MPLHPAIARMLADARDAGRGTYASGTVDQARTLLSQGSAALGGGPPVAAVRDVPIPTRTGFVAGRIYTPHETPCGCIVHVHGGGWTLGTLDDFDALARSLVARTGATVVLFAYRLAPEHPFPAGLEDTVDVLQWAGRPEAAEVLGAPGAVLPLVVSGDSAGANLATVALAQMQSPARAALQVLFYPVTDCDTRRASYGLRTDVTLTAEDMQWFFGHYTAQSALGDPRVTPLNAGCLQHLPPAWIAVAEFDVLHDEGVAYAQRLAAEGVPTELRDYKGLAHGFARMFNTVDAADQAVADAAAAIVRACRTGSAGETITRGRYEAR